MAFTGQDRQREDRVIGTVEQIQRFAERESLPDNIETFSGAWDEEGFEQVPSLHEYPDLGADFPDHQLEGSEHSQTGDSRAWESSCGSTPDEHLPLQHLHT